MFLWAGHGMIWHNSQVLLTNELNKKTKFYSFIEVEKQLRSLCSMNNNVYIISLFACCRQIWDPSKHCGMIRASEVFEES